MAESYIEGWKEIHMILTFGEACQYCAVIHKADMNEDVSLLPHRYGNARVKQPPIGCPNCKVEMPVFVNYGQFFEPSKVLHSGVVPSEARLFTLNHCLRFRRHPSNLTPHMVCEFPADFADWELGVATRLSTIVLNQTPGQVVKGRAQVMNDITDNGSKGRGYFPRTPSELKDFFASLRINLADDALDISFIEGTTPEGINAALQGFEVCLRPMQLKPTAVQCNCHVLYSEYEKGQEDGQEDTEDSQRPRDSHTHEGRVRAESKRSCKAQQITASKPEEVASETGHAHRLGDYSAKNTRSGSLVDV